MRLIQQTTANRVILESVLAITFAVSSVQVANGGIDDGGWAPVDIQPATIGPNMFVGMKAFAENDIWAVGNANAPEKEIDMKPLVSHYDGASWTHIDTPAPANFNILLDIDGVSSDDLWAVGRLNNTQDPTDAIGDKTLIMHWNGTQWSIVPSPNPSPASSAVTNVLALASDDVWAVGWQGIPAGFPPAQPLALHWDGKEWSEVSTPTFSTDDNHPVALHGTGPNDIWAVGHQGWPTPYHTLTMHWDGTEWTAVPTTDPGLNARHTDVVAIAPDNVWAVGWTHVDNVQVTLVEHWNGEQWQHIASPNHPIGISYLLGVHASGPNNIWAVGDNDRGGPDFPIALHWDGESFTLYEPPQPGISSSQQDVAVLSNGEAWLAGHYSPAAGPRYPLVMMTDGFGVAGDINGDGVVGVGDLLDLLSQWGPCDTPCSGDLDGDNHVGVSDLLTLLGNWTA